MSDEFVGRTFYRGRHAPARRVRIKLLWIVAVIAALNAVVAVAVFTGLIK